MKTYIQILRQFCDVNQDPAAPFVVRTRFERQMYGLLVSLALEAFADQPSSMEREAVMAFLAKHTKGSDNEVGRAMLRISRIFEKFTYLCDTSNWSNDGQDPRVEACRSDILALCEDIERLQEMN